MKEIFVTSSAAKKQLKNEQKEFEKVYKKPARSRSNIDAAAIDSSDLIESIRQNENIQFLILGEYHDYPSSYNWLEQNSDALAQAGFTIAMEFYGMWQQKKLDDYHSNKSKKIPDIEIYPWTQQEDRLWLNRKEKMLEIFKKAGLRVVGIESIQSHQVYDKYNYWMARGMRIKLLDKALPLALEKQGLLEPSKTNKVLIWVGSGHVNGMVEWLGRDRCQVVCCRDSVPSDNEEGTMVDFIVEPMDKKRYNLVHQLEHYIARIDGYKKKNTQNPFMEGFWFYKKSRANNREINYLLAKQLRQKLLEKDEQISDIFSSIAEKRAQIILDNGIQERSGYVERTINSVELKRIITEAQKQDTDLLPSNHAFN